MAYLGIDIGTTGVKAVIFGNNGSEQSSAYREYSLLSPRPGWFELNPQQIIDCCKQVIGESACQLPPKNKIRAVGISSQGEAFTLLDNNGDYLCNAMVSFDTRSTEQVISTQEEFGRERLYDITGHSSHTLFSLFKLLWIKNNHPKAFKKARHFLCMGDLLRFVLTGNSITSYNLAARTMLFDVKAKQWSTEILDYVGLNHNVMPQVAPSGSSAGLIKPEIAEELGLEKDVIVATGGHDQCCGALGVGVFEKNVAAYSLGTVGCITPAFSDCVLNKTLMDANLATYPHTVENLYTTVAFCTTAGSGLKWFKNNFGQAEIERARRSEQNVYDVLLEQIPPKPTNLMFLPHLCSTGTPYFEPNPMGAALGLKLSTTKGDILRALLEGICFEMNVNLNLLKKCQINIDELRAFGGGTASPAWMQITADIFDMPITIVEVQESGCMGAAMLAGYARGEIDSLSKCCEQWTKIGRVYEPGGENAAIYRQKFEVYKELYQNLTSVRDKLKTLY